MADLQMPIVSPVGRRGGPARFLAVLGLLALVIVTTKLATLALTSALEGRLPAWLTGGLQSYSPVLLVGLASFVIVRWVLATMPTVGERHALIAGLLVGGSVLAWDLVLARAMEAFDPALSTTSKEAIKVVSLCLAALPPAAWVLWLGFREERSEDEADDTDFRPHVIVVVGMLALLGFFGVVSLATAVAWLPEKQRIQSYAEILNVAGRQRMLSQQIGRYAALADAEIASSRDVEALQHAVARLQDDARRLDGLIGGIASASTNGGRDAFQALERASRLRLHLIDEVERFQSVAALRRNRTIGASLSLQQVSDRFLEASEQAAAMLEAEVAAAIERTASGIINLSILLSFILVMGGTSVILPVAWIVRRQHSRLTRHAGMLARSRDETRQMLAKLTAYQRALDRRVIVAITDRRGRIVDVNDRFCEISGYQRHELIGQTHRVVNSGQHSKAFFVGMWQTIARGDAWQGEICNRAKDGSLYWVDTTIVPMTDEDGRITQYLAIRYDITEQRLAQQALRESEAHLKQAQAVARIGSWVLDLRSNELRWSEETHRMFAVPQGTPLSYDLFLEMVHPDDRSLVNEAWNRALGGASYAVEHRIIVNGEVRHVQERADFERDASGRLIRATGTVQDITDRKRAEAEVLWQANYDALTGLPNRHLFRERLDQALDRALGGHHAGAVVMLDLDHFKNVNDTLGHNAGDQVLVETGNRLRKCVRDGDTVGRFGGDEFLVLLDRIDSLEEARDIVERMQAALSHPFVVDHREMHLAGSIGICVFPKDTTNLDEILKYADAAMYAAKKAGRRSYRFFTQQVHQENVETVAVIEELRRALAASELELHYQPIVDIATGRLSKCEALVRWRHPEKGLLTADRFIPIAEAFGLIAPITDFVVATATQQHAAWRKQGLDVEVSINVSADYLRFDCLTDQLIQAICGSGASESIVIELTESLLIKDEHHQFERLGRIVDAGIGIAIDDFGTGYSSLSYLARIPARHLKIDRAFIGKLGSRRERRLVTAIIGIAHDLEMSVVAEGVETPAQLEFLTGKGCDYAQGYMFSPPIPADRFVDFARSFGADRWRCDVAKALG